MLASAMTAAGCAEEKSKENAKTKVTETQKPQKTQEELAAEKKAKEAAEKKAKEEAEKKKLEAAEKAIECTEKLFFETLGLKSRLSDFNIDDSRFEEMAKNACGASGVIKGFVELKPEDVVNIYRMCL